MRQDWNLESWKVFCAVAEAGSISGACGAVGMDASGVSRTIRALEASLGGIPLFDRSIRPLKLTGNGETALVFARQMLASHAALVDGLDRDPLAMRGTISVGFPPLVLQKFLLPFLVAFHEEYPEVYLKVSEYTGSAPVVFDTPQGRLDVICGYGADAAHPNIVQIQYGWGYQIPCASPLYIARKGAPGRPEDLVRHTGIVLRTPMRPEVQCLQKGDETVPLRWESEMFFDSAASAMSAVLCGAGIHPGIPTLHCFRSLQKKELVPVLPGWSSPRTKLFIYARTEAARLRRVQVFIERYRAFMDRLHDECEKTFEPLVGPLELRYRA